MLRYAAPRLREYGDLEQLTAGCVNGNSDFGKGKVPPDNTDPGNPNNGNEGTNSDACVVVLS